MVGGDAHVLERVRPLLDCFASHIVHVGAHGHGTMAKLIHNMVGEIQVQSFAEAFCLGARLGMSLDQLFDALAHGMASSRILTQLLASGILRRRLAPNVSIDAAAKDQLLLQELHERIGVEPAFSRGVLERLREMQARGHGGLDVTSVLTLFEEMYGVTVSFSAAFVDPT